MVMSASSFSGFPADARILGLDIGSISVDVVLLDGLGTPLYSRYVRHHGQPDKVLCAELEALERTHAGVAAAVTGTGADRVGRLLGACAVNEVIAQVAAASAALAVRPVGPIPTPPARVRTSGCASP